MNSELSFDRYLHVGERLYYRSRIDQISEEKTTALGTGFFVTAIMTYFVEQDDRDDERVGELLFRVFKFKPAERPKAAEPAAAKTDAPKAMRHCPASATTAASSGMAAAKVSCSSSAARPAGPFSIRRRRCAAPARASSWTMCRPAGRASCIRSS